MTHYTVHSPEIGRGIAPYERLTHALRRAYSLLPLPATRPALVVEWDADWRPLRQWSVSGRRELELEDQDHNASELVEALRRALAAQLPEPHTGAHLPDELIYGALLERTARPVLVPVDPADEPAVWLASIRSVASGDPELCPWCRCRFPHGQADPWSGPPECFGARWDAAIALERARSSTPQ